MFECEIENEVICFECFIRWENLILLLLCIDKFYYSYLIVLLSVIFIFYIVDICCFCCFVIIGSILGISVYDKIFFVIFVDFFFYF